MSIFDKPNFTTPEIPEFDFRDPDEVTNRILTFLQVQSKTAERQFRTSRNLISATIIIMILQIGYAVWINLESNSKQYILNNIIETQSQQSEAASRMSLTILDLQNQVKILEKENKELSPR